MSDLYPALLKAQQQFQPIVKDQQANTGKFSYSYADLGSVLEHALPILHAQGLGITQTTDVTDLGEPLLVTTLWHTSGETISGRYPLRIPDPTDPQKLGGAVTYARRYALLSLLGLVTEDDDAQHARMPRNGHQETPEPRSVAPAAPQRPNGITPPTMGPTNGSDASWTSFWKEARALGFDPARLEDLEAAIGLKGNDPHNATQRLHDWIAERGDTPAPDTSGPAPWETDGEQFLGDTSDLSKARLYASKDPSSERQQKAVFAAAYDAGYDREGIKEAVKAAFGLEHFDDITKGQASRVIDTLNIKSGRGVAA